ncbi:hypothetical protein [Mesorhizobium neociceri]|uniref:Uncharacterized protein n=1 Tax=Mesorhizobium neociceri TaxID=1307853 RepID=A0A838AYS8_9HYPH|nr:hypothetical protein [Mesorhizobium neociceri]MBA1138822.1 hypothetical protein [Mesorhizobium neociceri]
MRSLVVAIALTTASIACPTLAGDRSAAVVAAGDEADIGKIPRFDKAGSDGAGSDWDRAKEYDDGAKDRDEAKQKPHAEQAGKPDAFELAARLSAVETRIGIRAGQLDAWRDYTASLQSVLASPRRSDDGQGAGETHGPKDPFDREQKLADAEIEKAAAAAKLKSAIATLRTVLSQQQLDLVASMNRRE